VTAPPFVRRETRRTSGTTPAKLPHAGLTTWGKVKRPSCSTAAINFPAGAPGPALRPSELTANGDQRGAEPRARHEHGELATAGTRPHRSEKFWAHRSKNFWKPDRTGPVAVATFTATCRQNRRDCSRRSTEGRRRGDRPSTDGPQVRLFKSGVRSAHFGSGRHDGKPAGNHRRHPEIGSPPCRNTPAGPLLPRRPTARSAPLAAGTFLRASTAPNQPSWSPPTRRGQAGTRSFGELPDPPSTRAGSEVDYGRSFTPRIDQRRRSRARRNEIAGSSSTKTRPAAGKRRILGQVRTAVHSWEKGKKKRLRAIRLRCWAFAPSRRSRPVAGDGTIDAPAKADGRVGSPAAVLRARAKNLVSDIPGGWPRIRNPNLKNPWGTSGRFGPAPNLGVRTKQRPRVVDDALRRRAGKWGRAQSFVNDSQLHRFGRAPPPWNGRPVKAFKHLSTRVGRTRDLEGLGRQAPGFLLVRDEDGDDRRLGKPERRSDPRREPRRPNRLPNGQRG